MAGGTGQNASAIEWRKALRSLTSTRRAQRADRECVYALRSVRSRATGDKDAALANAARALLQEVVVSERFEELAQVEPRWVDIAKLYFMPIASLAEDLKELIPKRRTHDLTSKREAAAGLMDCDAEHWRSHSAREEPEKPEDFFLDCVTEALIDFDDRAQERTDTEDAAVWTFARVGKAFTHLMEALGEWIPDKVVGINRGGPIIGGMLAKKLGLPFVSLDLIVVEGEADEQLRVVRKPSRDATAQRVLLVDDSYRTGRHSRCALEELKDLYPDAEIRFAVLLRVDVRLTAQERSRKHEPDYAGDRSDRGTLLLPWDLY